MGWLKKIFKGSSHSVNEGRNRWNERYDEHVNTSENEPSSPREPWSEVEDIDHAIALSLAEEEHKRKGFVENESQLSEDEQLAKALQESLNVDSPPRHGNRNEITNMSGNGNIYHPIPFPYSTGFRYILPNHIFFASSVDQSMLALSYFHLDNDAC